MTEGNGQGPTEHRDAVGDDVGERLRALLHEGYVRRVVVANDRGETIVDVPMTVGAVAVVVAPLWAVVGAVAALVTNCTIKVERREEETQ